MKRLLFICGANKLRSPTAEHVFSTWTDVETDSAGLNVISEQQLSSEQIEWADIIFVMEKSQRSKVSTRFRKYLKGKRIVCLDISDNYAFMDPALVRLLEARVKPFMTQRS
jgi:predicted protein tyrosine phosphatase